jgi:hypothetical protein
MGVPASVSVLLIGPLSVLLSGLPNGLANGRQARRLLRPPRHLRRKRVRTQNRRVLLRKECAQTVSGLASARKSGGTSVRRCVRRKVSVLALSLRVRRLRHKRVQSRHVRPRLRLLRRRLDLSLRARRRRRHRLVLNRRVQPRRLRHRRLDRLRRHRLPRLRHRPGRHRRRLLQRLRRLRSASLRKKSNSTDECKKGGREAALSFS